MHYDIWFDISFDSIEELYQNTEKGRIKRKFVQNIFVFYEIPVTNFWNFSMLCFSQRKQMCQIYIVVIRLGFPANPHLLWQ